MTDRLAVWWDDRLTGTLSIDRHGETRFRYVGAWLDDERAPAISRSLPKRKRPFGRRACRPFFGGLLPEAEQRAAIARALGVSAENEFRLLERLGGEVAGALQLLPEGEAPRQQSDDAPRILNKRELLALLKRLPSRPMLAGEGGWRLSLAGVQVKLPVLVSEGAIALPPPGAPTTHILKPAIDRFPGSAANEFFCLRLAASVGLQAAGAEFREVGGESFLLVERYDRTRHASGIVERIHQEDFAQALSVPTERKYAADGGPVFRDCFALLRRAATRPARDVLRLLDAAIFNLIVGNADAHAKNFSLLYKDGEIALSPLYDLVCTALYPDLAPNLAMKIAGKARLEELEARHWPRFAAEAGSTAPYVRKRVRQLAEKVRDVACARERNHMLAIPDGVDIDAVANLVADRAARLALKT